MRSFFIKALMFSGLLIFSCTNKSDKQNQERSSDSDTITEVPDENVRPTGDSRSIENVDLDTTNKSSE